MAPQWLMDFVAFLAQFSPIRIVMNYQGGVCWTFGKNPKMLSPGIHWVWLPFQHIAIMSMVEEVRKIPLQKVTTMDGVVVCFSACISRRVTDPIRCHCEVENFEESSDEIAMTHLAKRMRILEYQDLVRGGLNRLEDSLKETLGRSYAVWGAEVLRVSFTDFYRREYPVRLITEREEEKEPALV